MMNGMGWNVSMKRDLRLMLLWKMCGGREVSWLELRFMSEGREGRMRREWEEEMKQDF